MYAQRIHSGKAQLPVGNKHIGKTRLLPGLEGLFHNGKAAVGLQYGIGDGFHIKYIPGPQMVAQVGNGVIGGFHHLLLQHSVPDEHQRRTAHEAAEGAPVQAELGNDLLHQIQSQDGYDAVQQGDAGIRYGKGGQIRYAHGDEQIIRLQVADLAFARHAQNDQNKAVKQHGPQK